MIFSSSLAEKTTYFLSIYLVSFSDTFICSLTYSIFDCSFSFDPLRLDFLPDACKFELDSLLFLELFILDYLFDWAFEFYRIYKCSFDYFLCKGGIGVGWINLAVPDREFILESFWGRPEIWIELCTIIGDLGTKDVVTIFDPIICGVVCISRGGNCGGIG